MTVTAIIPTYNRTEILCSRALPSVLNQSHPVDEIVIVADGMEPEAYDDMVNALYDMPPFGGRLMVVNGERPAYPEWPGGLWLVQGYAARNRGLDMAMSDWVAPLDDDDEWTPDHIEVLLNGVNSTGADFVYGKAVTPDGQWYGFWPPSGANFTDGSQLYRRDLGYRYDPECVTRGKAADQDLWDRMVEGGVQFTFVDRLVHRYYPANR